MRRNATGVRLALGLAIVLIVAVEPVSSQIALLFPYGVAAGDVSPSAAVLWARPGRRVPVVAEASSDRAFGTIAFSAHLTPSAERGGAVKVVAGGLRPGTRYYYRFTVGRGARSEIGTFVTPPQADVSRDLRLAFSGDIDATNVGGAPAFSLNVLEAAAADRPDVFILLGDTIYSDSSHMLKPARTLDEYRAKYRELQATPPMRALMRATSIVAMWDDHEVENDFDRESVDQAKFAAGLRAFLEAWPIAGQGDRLYRSFRWGKDVEVFLPDLRSHRSRQVSKTRVCDNPPGSVTPDLAPTLAPQLRAGFAPLLRQLALPVPAGCLAAINDPNRTMLGPVQKRWLLDGLRGSQATWKFIASEVPIQELYAGPYDRWEGYAAERAEILNFIRSANIKNVVWLSADVHAVLINDIRLGSAASPFESSGMKEVVAGPIAAGPFATAIARIGGTQAVPVFAAFLQAAPPQGLGMACAVLDRFTYAMVEVTGGGRTVTITPKDAAGQPVCRAPLVLSAQ